MTQPQKHIDDLKNDGELIRLLSPNRDTRIGSQMHATQLRDRIATLKARLVTLHRNRSED